MSIHIRRFNLETGETTFESDCETYEFRHPKGLLAAHASPRRFQIGKPRYRRYRGVLVMARTPNSRSKKTARLCPVLAFPNGGPR